MSRPFDTWRLCGHRVDHRAEGHGCTCKVYDPTPWLADKASARLAREKEVRPVPIDLAARRAARRAAG
jgi:hypothetical protein